MNRFKDCLRFTAAEEGGWADRPASHDPGGATMYGITIATLSEWRGHPVSKEEVRALSRDEAERIYFARYWTASNCHAMPAGLDLVMFDSSVLCGPGRAVMFLQAALGVTVDGGAGNLTMGAMRAFVAKNGVAPLIDATVEERRRFLANLPNAQHNPGWALRTGRLSVKAHLDAATVKAQPAAVEVVADKATAAKAAAQAAGGAAVVVGGVAASIPDPATIAAYAPLFGQGVAFVKANPEIMIVVGVVVVGVGVWQWTRDRKVKRRFSGL